MSGLFPDPQDEEAQKWQALLGMDQLQAPMLQDPSAQAMAQQPMPAPAPAPHPDQEAYQALASSLPEPPHVDYTNQNVGYVLAMFADALLNKGRGAGGLIGSMASRPDATEANYKIDRQHALDQAQLQHQAQSHQEDPRLLAIREGELSARQKALELQNRQLDGKGGAGDGLTAYQREEIRLREAELAARATPKAAPEITPYQAEMLALRSEERGARGEERAARADERATNKNSQLSREFTRDTTRIRQAAQAANNVDEILTKYPEGSDIPGIGKFDGMKPDFMTGEDGIALRKNQMWLNDSVLRMQTGAAAPLAEQDKNMLMAGTKSTMTEQEFRKAHEITSKFLRDNLRAASVGREGPAGDVMKAEGIDQFVNGGDQPAASSGPDPHDPGAFVPQGGKYLQVGHDPKVKDVAKRYASFGWTPQ